MTELAELANTLEVSGHLLAALLVLSRVAPLVYLTPFLGGPTLSTPLRIVVAGAITVAVYPAATSAPLEGLGGAMVVVLIAKEMVIGASLGLLAAVAFHALAMAGQMIDIARGSAMAQILDPATGTEQSPLASLYLQLGIVVFLALGGHRAFLAALAGSYDLVPLAELPLCPPGLGDAALLSAALVGSALAAAVMMAAPAMAAVVLVDLALGLLGRTAPQVGTYFMAMPLRAAAGLAMVLLSLGMLLPELAAFLGGATAAVERAAELIGGSR